MVFVIQSRKYSLKQDLIVSLLLQNNFVRLILDPLKYGCFLCTSWGIRTVMCEISLEANVATDEGNGRNET